MSLLLCYLVTFVSKNNYTRFISICQVNDRIDFETYKKNHTVWFFLYVSFAWFPYASDESQQNERFHPYAKQNRWFAISRISDISVAALIAFVSSQVGCSHPKDNLNASE
ncbi:hypothetical protein J2Z70_002942 [Paenibacillus silagei]|uniref:Uncharacterized protein n=1 Tax=Paenibacillus silagei TaxID=1670801 RepID=A0ABS4NRU7_9BACL|nr:hypothetical protein [Paenibacillus silagei]